MRNHFQRSGQHYQVDVLSTHPLKVAITCGDEVAQLSFEQELSTGRGRLRLGGRSRAYFVTESPTTLWVTLAGQTFVFEKKKGSASPSEEEGRDSFAAPMPGKVIKVNHLEGDSVGKGQVLIIMEAMKMEHRMEAPAAGTVTKLHCKEGDVVDQGFQLLEFEVEGPN